jgi:hypothetical protein
MNGQDSVSHPEHEERLGFFAETKPNVDGSKQ